ncbi:DUF2570 domain-containing protein [Proteus mirabilis]|uniref:DUF2570 domain-containing protein n=1 Tax=Proteus mirabilis TaxID=584 RepID=UPI0009CC0341|nr:DUF2570 domain-containing protein [Proteus mirabilis]MBG6041462.1 DUF2570 domain-containing protein [Proteus mirabilis]MCY9776104.1 DUF2570 domain-containing protein [Proteus mirabilis]MCY9782207.1 DUF2570 domain-containing protein [Proteus mirabilis]MCY9790032.1 DUF2570 domain-containing protein [Proteus mirabilis]OOQ49861.1 hypothetical protein A0O00_10195 [Proteus mirabilis]
MMIGTLLRLGVKGGIAAIIVVTLLVIRYQYNQINRLLEQNSRLDYQQRRLQTQLAQWHQQAENVSETLKHQQKEQQYLEEENHVIRQELRQLMLQTPCANELVPDAVIQLQQNVINNNAQRR